MTDTAVLQATGLSGGYGAVQVLSDVTIDVGHRAITALIGGNGAGKTTTMRLLAGLLPAASGEIRFEDNRITDSGPAARVAAGIALVPEGRLVFPDMTVDENLRLGAYTARARPHTEDGLERIYTMFPRLAERRRQAGSTLSGGEQQMLALGRGLMSRPKVLLLDEPSLGLAPQMVDLIFQAIVDLPANGVSVFLSEQNVGRTLQVATQAYVLENGRVALEGPAVDLLDMPEVKSAYLGL